MYTGFVFHCVIEKSIYYFMHAVYLDLFVGFVSSKPGYSNLGNDRHPLLSMETISGNGRRLDGGCGIGAYDRMLLFDKKEVFAWNMVNFQSVKYGI